MKKNDQEPIKDTKALHEKTKQERAELERPKRLENIYKEDDINNTNIDKFILSIMKMKKESENSKIPSFLNDKLGQETQDFFKMNINDFDLKIVNSIFSRRSDDIDRELKDVQLDIDFGIYDFQRKFYARYVLLKYGDGMSETDKAKNLKIKVKINKENSVHLTRTKLDSYLTNFRKIFNSFCQIRSFLTNEANQKFDEFFDFEVYLIIEEDAKERMVIKENFNSLEVVWESEDSESKTDDFDNKLNKDYYKSYLVSLFKNNIFTAIKTITGIMDLSNEKVVAILTKNHRELFEYLLKNQKLAQNKFMNNKNQYQKWRNNLDINEFTAHDLDDIDKVEEETDKK